MIKLYIIGSWTIFLPLVGLLFLSTTVAIWNNFHKSSCNKYKNFLVCVPFSIFILSSDGGDQNSITSLLVLTQLWFLAYMTAYTLDVKNKIALYKSLVYALFSSMFVLNINISLFGFVMAIIGVIFAILSLYALFYAFDFSLRKTN